MLVRSGGPSFDFLGGDHTHSDVFDQADHVQARASQPRCSGGGPIACMPQ
jgi:hypothetical protein